MAVIPRDIIHALVSMGQTSIATPANLVYGLIKGARLDVNARVTARILVSQITKVAQAASSQQTTTRQRGH